MPLHLESVSGPIGCLTGADIGDGLGICVHWDDTAVSAVAELLGAAASALGFSKVGPLGGAWEGASEKVRQACVNLLPLSLTLNPRLNTTNIGVQRFI